MFLLKYQTNILTKTKGNKGENISKIALFGFKSKIFYVNVSCKYISAHILVF